MWSRRWGMDTLMFAFHDFCRVIFLKRSLVFPILLFSSLSLHWSLRKAFLSLLALLWNSAFKWEYLCFSLFFFSQLFVRPPQRAVLLFCISFPWGWSWSLPSVQCHEPPSIVHQALCNIALYSIGPCFYHQSHPQLGIIFALAPSLHSFWNYFSIYLQ